MTTRRLDGPGGQGVIVTCESQADDRLSRVTRCLRCGKPFALRRVAVTVWALGEEVGFIGEACCLRASSREKFEAYVRAAELQQRTEEPR